MVLYMGNHGLTQRKIGTYMIQWLIDWSIWRISSTLSGLKYDDSCLHSDYYPIQTTCSSHWVRDNSSHARFARPVFLRRSMHVSCFGFRKHGFHRRNQDSWYQHISKDIQNHEIKKWYHTIFPKQNFQPFHGWHHLNPQARPSSGLRRPGSSGSPALHIDIMVRYILV